MSSKTIWTGVRGALSARARAVSAGAAAGPRAPRARGADGCAGRFSDGGAVAGREGWRKRSRNWSSRNSGVRGTRSMRASSGLSVRWAVVKRMNLPSGLQLTPPPNTLGRKLIARGAPPAAGTTKTVLNIETPAER